MPPTGTASASLLPSYCQAIPTARLLPACCQAIANQLPGFCQNVAKLLPSGRIPSRAVACGLGPTGSEPRAVQHQSKMPTANAVDVTLGGACAELPSPSGTCWPCPGSLPIAAVLAFTVVEATTTRQHWPLDMYSAPDCLPVCQLSHVSDSIAQLADTYIHVHVYKHIHIRPCVATAQ